MNNFYNDNESLKFYLHHPLMEKIITLKENGFAEKDDYDTAPANTEDAVSGYEKVMELVGEISAGTIAENADSVDAQGPSLVNNEILYAEGTRKNHRIVTESGLYGISLPRKYNGLNLPRTCYVMAVEQIARADASFASLWGLQDCAETIDLFADEETKRQYLPLISKGCTCSMDLTEPDAGSDLQAVRLRADFDEECNCWRLNGVKRFITNGDADIKLVLARSEEGTTDGRGLSYFLYDRRDKAVTIRRIENKLGIKGSPTAELFFNNAPARLVGERKLGLIKYVMSLMNGARLVVGAQSVGLSEAASREAFAYAAQREQFGKPIAELPQVAEILVNMRTKTDAVRSLLYETARFVDIYTSYEKIAKTRPLLPDERSECKTAQRYADIFTPLLKFFSSEYANRNAYDCIQVHGGSGYMKEYVCERLYRDARILSIYEGTSQLQVIAAVKGVANGSFLKRMVELDGMPVAPALETVREKLAVLTDVYKESVGLASAETQKQGTYDFMARKLVESAGYIIMGYLLLQDASRDGRFEKSCRVFVNLASAEIAGNIDFIRNFDEIYLQEQH